MNSDQDLTNSNSQSSAYNSLNHNPTEVKQVSKAQTNETGWNPFTPTVRDIKRTEQLAQKNLVVTILLGLLFPIGNLFYLNRGANAAKLFVYTVSLGLIITIAGGSTVNPEAVGRGTFQVTNWLMGLEQIVCILQAKNRNQQRTE